MIGHRFMFKGEVLVTQKETEGRPCANCVGNEQHGPFKNLCDELDTAAGLDCVDSDVIYLRIPDAIIRKLSS